MVAVSSALVSHTQSVPKPPVASLRCFHVCKQADLHLCTEIIFTHDSLLLYILAALNYEISCLFIVFEYNFEPSSLWQLTTVTAQNGSFYIHIWYLFSKILNVMKTHLLYCLEWSTEQSSLKKTEEIGNNFFFFGVLSTAYPVKRWWIWSWCFWLQAFIKKKIKEINLIADEKGE